MASGGRRIGVVGATGSLGTELLERLARASIRVSEIVPVATDQSLGRDVEFQGSDYPVEIDGSRLAATDLIFLCTPPAAALDYVRLALEAHVPCIDLTGALARSEEVPMRVAGYGAVPEGAPALAIPAGPSLAWVLVLQPLAAAAGLRRVVGTALQSAASVGRRGIESLYGESIALFNQQQPPHHAVFPGPVAFDCLPGVGELDADGNLVQESQLAADLAFLLGPETALAVTVVQIPVFAGHGATIWIETERELDPRAAEDLLRKAPGVEVWESSGLGPTIRSAVGSDLVTVGRVRRDRSSSRGLLFWIVADPLRLAASHAIQLAALRLG